MAGFLFLLVLVLVLCSASVFGQFPSCNVCGDGREVFDREAIFGFPGQPSVPCGILEEAGKNGQIPNDSCGFLPPLIRDMCSCYPIGSPVAPTPMPAPIIMRPTAPGGCNVCGDGLGVSDPDAIFAFPGQPSVPCGMLEQAGLDGLNSIDGCPILQQYLSSNGMCNCTPLTLSPVAPTTAAPIAPTSQAPQRTTTTTTIPVGESSSAPSTNSPSSAPSPTNSPSSADPPTPRPQVQPIGSGVTETDVPRATDGRTTAPLELHEEIFISMAVLAFTLMVIMTIMVLRRSRRKWPRCRRCGHEADGGATVTTEFDDKQKEDTSLSEPNNEGVAEDIVKPAAASQVEYPKNARPPRCNARAQSAIKHYL